MAAREFTERSKIKTLVFGNSMNFISADPQVLRKVVGRLAIENDSVAPIRTTDFLQLFNYGIGFLLFIGRPPDLFVIASRRREVCAQILRNVLEVHCH